MPTVDETPATPTPSASGPTPIQILSAAAQNIAAMVIVGIAWFYGKVTTEVALSTIALVVGVDFLGRKRLGVGPLTVAWGASNIFTAFDGWLTAAVLAVTLGSGCAAFPKERWTELAQKVYQAACEDPQTKPEMAACYNSSLLFDELDIFEK